mgnify:CR=1 FL=1
MHRLGKVKPDKARRSLRDTDVTFGIGDPRIALAPAFDGLGISDGRLGLPIDVIGAGAGDVFGFD